MTKKSKKSGKGKDDFYEQLVTAKADGGWQTGPATAMDEDDDKFVPIEPEVHAKKSGSTSGMEVDKPGKAGLKLQNTSMKRGQRTKSQKIRKAVKVAKAMERVEKSSIKVAKGVGKKTKKLTLRSIY